MTCEGGLSGLYCCDFPGAFVDLQLEITSRVVLGEVKTQTRVLVCAGSSADALLVVASSVASYLSFFIAWCEARSIARPQEVTKPILERYQRHLFHLRKTDGKPLSFRAQFARLVPVRAAKSTPVICGPVASGGPIGACAVMVRGMVSVAAASNPLGSVKDSGRLYT